MSMAEAASIPLGLATAALGLALPYSDTTRGGAALKPFWESDAEGYYKDNAMVIMGGSSAVGQFSEPQ
jgi:NADPH:quinone reductase-like Zn-dependent oxidoreductase